MADRNLTTRRLWGQFMTREGMMLYIPADDDFSMDSIPQTIDFHRKSTVQEFPLGSRLMWGERVFRYYKNDAVADVAGNLYQMEVPVAGHIDEALDEPVAGATVVSFTPTTTNIDADEYVNGYFYINDDTGEGYMHRVKSHGAITAAVAGNITLYDPIVVTLGALATGTLLNSPYRAPIITAVPPTALEVGFAQAAVAASGFGWLCVSGPTPALTNGTLVIDDSVMASDAVAGAVEDWALAVATPDAEITRAIGVCMAVNADTEYSAVWALVS